MISKNEAQALYEYYDKLITKLTEAKLALVKGGVKSYTVDDRSLTRFDIDKLSKEIDEAARIEGYSWFRVFLSIDIPLAKSGLAATAVFCAINSWNEFLMALILTGRDTATMPVAIPGMLTPQGTLWGQIAAVGTVITIPVLIFAIIVQKHMVAGMTMGAVK